MTQAVCAFCGKPVKPGESRRLPRALVVVASAAAAFAHAGMWVVETLDGEFCARDASLVGGTVLGAAVLVLCAAAFGVAIWLSAPKMK